MKINHAFNIALSAEETKFLAGILVQQEDHDIKSINITRYEDGLFSVTIERDVSMETQLLSIDGKVTTDWNLQED